MQEIPVQLRSVTQLCLTLFDPMNCSMSGFPVYHQLPEFAQTHVYQVGDAIQPSHSLSSPSPPAFNLSSIRVFSKEPVLCIRWPKNWSFSFSISPSNEYSGLISFIIDRFDLLAVQVTLKRLLQHHRSKASILQCSAFFIVQLSHPCMTAGKTIALTRWTFVENCPNLLELISEFYRETGYKISIYKLIVFPYTSNEHASIEIRNTIPFAFS